MHERHAWTVGQERVLEELCSRGAAECAREIYRRFGVRRSVAAVRMHASRMGVSLVRYETCPQCGRKVAALRYTGLCDLCHERSFLSPSDARSAVMRDMEPTEEDRRAVEEAQRRRAAERQRAHRAKCCYKRR